MKKFCFEASVSLFNHITNQRESDIKICFTYNFAEKEKNLFVVKNDEGNGICEAIEEYAESFLRDSWQENFDDNYLPVYNIVINKENYIADCPKIFLKKDKISKFRYYYGSCYAIMEDGEKIKIFSDIEHTVVGSTVKED